MNADYILLALSPIFIMFIVWEFITHRRKYQLKDSLCNFALAGLHQFSELIALFLLMPFFWYIYDLRLFTFEHSSFAIFLGFLLQDFCYYWFHRASHNIHWLWSAHVVHHSSEEMNLSTAFRQSLMYPVAGMWIFWLPMILLGFQPNWVFTIVALNLAFQFFVHTQVVSNLNWLEQIFNTPSHHRVHHAVNPVYRDKNFAGVLIIWDKCFGTFQQEIKSEPCQYGIVKPISSFNPLYVTFHQWQEMFSQMLKAKTLKQKLHCLFGYPY